MTTPMPMFPLGTVLLPGSFLPLHIFEHRYRQLVVDCLAGDSCFGVTLISRGVEVGGGDERTTVGVIARIVEAVEYDDGRWAIGAVSTARIQVTDWLSDEPYPRALVEEWPDDTGESIPDVLVARLIDLLAAVTAMARVLGEPVAPSISELPVGASEVSFALSSASPLGSADRYDLLCAAGPLERLQLLEQRLNDQQVLYGARIAMEQG